MITTMDAFSDSARRIGISCVLMRQQKGRKLPGIAPWMNSTMTRRCDPPGAQRVVESILPSQQPRSKPEPDTTLLIDDDRCAPLPNPPVDKKLTLSWQNDHNNTNIRRRLRQLCLFNSHRRSNKMKQSFMRGRTHRCRRHRFISSCQ